MSEKKVDIILPNRIGDAVLSLPALVCLKQLISAYAPNDYKIRIFPFNSLSNVVKCLNIFETKRLSLVEKVKSWMFPSDAAFFLWNTSKNLGFHSKVKYGIRSDHKKYLRFKHELPYLDINHVDSLMPEELISFLREKYKFSTAIIRCFGICLELGFTVEQIISTFQFDNDSLSLKQELTKWSCPVKPDYVIFCMEAAYGRKVDADRRWDDDNYFHIAEDIHNKYGYKSVFIGISRKNPIPKKEYLIDTRGKLNLSELAKLIKDSKGYIGNDTGPLHIANLMKKPSIGIYFRKWSLKDYTPVFPDLNKIIFNPDKIDDILASLDHLVH